MSSLTYKTTASHWNEGLPIGNGKLGAMLYGPPGQTVLQCNEDSIWQGSFRDRNPHLSKEKLLEIQELVFSNRLVEAQKQIQLSMTGIPEFQRIYEPAGSIYVSSSELPPVTYYERNLDLTTAVVSEKVETEEYIYETQSFASYPMNIIAYRFASNDNIKQSYTIAIDRLRGNYDSFLNESTDECAIVGFTGQTANDGVQYAQFMKVVTDGDCEVNGQYVTVSDFTELIIYTTAATSFRHSNPKQHCLEVLQSVNLSDYKAIKEEHIEDYRSLYNNMTLKLSYSEEPADVPSLLNKAQNGVISNELTELMFDYGRYLLIASSRPGSLPANLQGIWNKDIMPAWDSKFTININTEMNYWPAEKTGLSECHLPLFEHLKRMHPNGLVTAEKMYGLEGFAAHHNTDIWGDTAPQDAYMPASYWPLGAVWLSLHVWEHYLYTHDTAFLENHFYLIEDALRFILHYLVESPEGYLVTNPSVSPENSFYTESGKMGYISYGSTMDNQIIWEAIHLYLKAEAVVPLDDSLKKKAEDTLLKLPPHQVDKKGRLMEWISDYPEAEPGHRHFSHLFGVYPGHRVKTDSADIKSAAKKALTNRLEHGGAHTGWSAAWLINLWAHFHEPDAFHHAIAKQLTDSTLPNLLDNHPPFQIDGNFGFTSGIIEGLIQLFDDRLDLLPALPAQWTEGEAKGIRLPGNVSVDINWANNQLITVTFYGHLEKEMQFYLKRQYLGKLKDVLYDKRFKLKEE